jgi:hypothetical protein
MLAVIDEIRERSRMPYRTICEAAKLPYPSLMRWRVRRRDAAPLVRRPGPSKIVAPDYDRLGQAILQLSHGHARTQGTGALYAHYAPFVSRREIKQLVALAQHDQNTAHRQNLRRISWNVPNVAWSMDPCEYHQREAGKVYLNQVQDLASRYKFQPLAGNVPCGEEIAGHLAETFKRFGAPLLLKRDNGGNLNHAAVNDVLAAHHVLPVNSPVHYPPYNGAIEEAQLELKNGLAAKLAYRPACPREHLEAYAGTVEHDLNHRPRPCLNGRTSCQMYFVGRRTFTKWERRDAYAWIVNMRDAILNGDGVKPNAAWRIATEEWLRMKGYITITTNGKVSPSFP